MENTDMIKEKLQKIGLTKGESEIYEILIESGQTKAGTIIKKSTLASSKVYDVLQRLVNKGLASFIIKEGIKHYQATPPERLIDFLNKKKEDINDAQKEIVGLIPLIKKHREWQEESNARMYSGKEGPKIVLKELIEESRKEGYNYGYGTQENPFVEHFFNELNEFFKAEKRYGFKTQLIFTEGHKQKQPNADIKYLPQGFIAPVRTMISGNKVFLVDFTEPFTTIIIENKQIAQSYRDHFKLLWKIAQR